MKKKKTTNNHQQARAKAGEARAAFERFKPEMMRLEANELHKVTTEVARAAGVVEAALPRIREHEEALKALPGFNKSALDALEDLALAAWHADINAPAPTDSELEALLEEATALKEKLLVNADALAHSKIVTLERVAEIRKGSGHRDTANDMIALADLFHEVRDIVAGRTLVTDEEVERSAELGTVLWRSVNRSGRRRITAAPVAVDMRRRAFSLLWNRYREVQHGIRFLRRDEGDADEIAPSMFAREGLVRRAADDVAVDDAPVEPATPVATVPATPIATPPVTTTAPSAPPHD